MDSAEHFERALARSIDAWHRPAKTRPQAPLPAESTPGMVVTYTARRHRLAADERYTVRVDSVSRLEARLAAERHAREHRLQFGHVVEYRRSA